MTVRPATSEDAKAILDIYAPYILDSFITFENEVPDLDSFKGRIAHYTGKFPWLVGEVGGRIAGYVYASPHRDRAAYQWCCESSIYMHDDFRGKGLGRILYSKLFSLLTIQGMRNVYAGITLPNDGSIRLHESLQFRWLATYENIGYKLGAWKSVGWWERQLNSFEGVPEPPTWYPQLNKEDIKKALG